MAYKDSRMKFRTVVAKNFATLTSYHWLLQHSWARTTAPGSLFCNSIEGTAVVCGNANRPVQTLAYSKPSYGLTASQQCDSVEQERPNVRYSLDIFNLRFILPTDISPE